MDERNRPRSNFPVQLLSDIHLEIERPDVPELYEFDFPVRAENLAILGDLGLTKDKRIFAWLDVQLTRFRRILFVAGNHESYGSSLEESHKRLSEYAAAHSESTEESTNGIPKGTFVYLSRTRYDVSSTLTILGCTLWADINPDDLDILSWSLNDFKRIKNFDSDAFSAVHKGDLSWLNNAVSQIRKEEPARRITILTHHAPTVSGVQDSKWIGGPTMSAFCTELTDEPCWGAPVTTWGFGHTHWCCDFEKKGVRLVANQRGYDSYDSGAAGFDPGKVIDL